MRGIKLPMLFVSLLLLNGCTTLYDQQYVEWETITPAEFPVLTAVGYAPLQQAESQTAQHQQLAAMRASKLDAYRELAEQVYGQRISGNTAVGDWLVQNDQFVASVDGVIRGAEVVRSYQTGGFYVTELKLDFEQVHYLYTATSRPQRVKEVIYY